MGFRAKTGDKGAKPCTRVVISPALQALLVLSLLAASAASPLCAALPLLPDPLVLADATPVDSPALWAKRRAEMKAILEDTFTGHMPASPGNVTAETVRQQTVAAGTEDYRLLQLRFGPRHSLGLRAALFAPHGQTRALPCIVFPTFTGTPGDERPPYADAKYVDVDPDRFARDHASLFNHGYALLTFYYQQGALDRPDNRSTGFFPAYPDADWGSLALWAWSASRGLDYLLSSSLADPSQVVLVGHSRLGKAALIAGAFDERFSLVVAAGSGCGGTGLFRVNGALRQGKEGLEEATHRFPQWFSPRLAAFSHRVEALPFDQHWLVALVAPRPFLDTEAFDDPACNGKASVATFQAARSVYQFLHAEDRMGLHFREGGHALTQDDWEAILDFADHQLRGKPTARDFSRIPDASRLH